MQNKYPGLNFGHFHLEYFHLPLRNMSSTWIVQFWNLMGLFDKYIIIFLPKNLTTSVIVVPILKITIILLSIHNDKFEFDQKELVLIE